MASPATFKDLNVLIKTQVVALHVMPGIVTAPLGVLAIEGVQKARGRKVTKSQKVFGAVLGVAAGGALGHVAYRNVVSRATKHWSEFKGTPGKGQ